jgi:hypothetical protein
MVLVGSSSIQCENAHITTGIGWYPSSSFGANMTWKEYNTAVENFFTLTFGRIFVNTTIYCRVKCIKNNQNDEKAVTQTIAQTVNV